MLLTQFAGQHDAGRCDVCHNAIVIFVTTDFCSAAAASLAFAAVKKGFTGQAPGQGANLLETRGRDVLSDRAIEVS